MPKWKYMRTQVRIYQNYRKLFCAYRDVHYIKNKQQNFMNKKLIMKIKKVNL